MEERRLAESVPREGGRARDKRKAEKERNVKITDPRGVIEGTHGEFTGLGRGGGC